MDKTIIAFPKGAENAGFLNWQFKKLDQLYLQAAAKKTLHDRAVDCDFEEGTATFTYYRVKGVPYLQFLIRKLGPRSVMFELYQEGRGRIMKSGLFERAYEKLEAEIQKLSV